jgi:hypothetical protein
MLVYYLLELRKSFDFSIVTKEGTELQDSYFPQYPLSA